MNLKSMALMGGVVLLLQLAGCQQGGTGAAGEKFVQIGTTKADLLGLPPEYRALHPRLEEVLACNVRFNPQPNGEAIGTQLAQGNFQFAVLTAREYAAVDDPSKLTLVAAAMNPLGNTSRKALIVARATDSRFHNIGDCAGKRFAFGTFGDALTDYATRQALEKNGVPLNKLISEIVLLTPPPFNIEGRLYCQDDVASKIALDITVNAGVIDEVVWSKLPATGGNPLTGPSKDQFKVIGETAPVPEMVVVAGPSADAASVEQLKAYLISRAKDDKMVCEQLQITGFAEADRASYDAAREMLKSAKS